MAVSFLQRHNRHVASTTKANLGVLLLEFFELYGRDFNYSQTAIRLRDGGAYIPEREVLRNLPAASNASNGVTLCIEDLVDLSNDVGRGSFLFHRVKSAFEDAYIKLQRLLRPDKIMLGEAAEDKSRPLDAPSALVGICTSFSISFPTSSITFNLLLTH